MNMFSNESYEFNEIKSLPGPLSISLLTGLTNLGYYETGVQ